MRQFVIAMGVCLVLSVLMAGAAETIVNLKVREVLVHQGLTPEQAVEQRIASGVNFWFLYPFFFLHSFTLYSVLNLVQLSFEGSRTPSKPSAPSAEASS